MQIFLAVCCHIFFYSYNGAGSPWDVIKCRTTWSSEHSHYKANCLYLTIYLLQIFLCFTTSLSKPIAPISLFPQNLMCKATQAFPVPGKRDMSAPWYKLISFHRRDNTFQTWSSYPLEVKRGEPMRWIAELEKSQDEGRRESLGKSSSGQVLTSDRNSLLYSVLQWLPFLDLKLLL